MARIKLVVYHGLKETLVTTTELEQDFIKEFFDETDRNINDYPRDEVDADGLRLTSSLHTHW